MGCVGSLGILGKSHPGGCSCTRHVLILDRMVVHGYSLIIYLNLYIEHIYFLYINYFLLILMAILERNAEINLAEMPK
jgi:hypothetical protein